jgi:hypothetical protein
MDGTHRDTSMRLVLASVPLQALMMVGAAGLLFGGMSSAPAQNVQVNMQFGPPGGSDSRVAVVVPLEGCQPSGYNPDGSNPGDPVANGFSPSALGSVAGCVDSYFYDGTDNAPDVAYLPVTCCGG